MLSWADTSASFFFRAKFCMEGYSMEGAESQIMALGIRPKFKKKGAYPVLADLGCNTGHTTGEISHTVPVTCYTVPVTIPYPRVR